MTLSAFELVQALIIIVGAGVVGLTARPAWTVSIGLALTVFSGHWDDMGVPIPLDRLLLGIGSLSALYTARRADRTALRTQPMDWLLVVVALYAVCSAVVSGALDESQARFSLLDTFSLVGFSLFFVAGRLYRTEEDRRILLVVLVALGAYLGLDALIETTGPRAILLPRYIDDPAVGIHFDRARGPFAEAAANGLGLLICTYASGVAAVTWKGRGPRRFATAVAGLCLLGTLLTLTRSVWLAAVLSTVLVLLAARETRRLTVPLVTVGALVVLGAFAAIPGLQGRAQARENDDRPLWDRRNSDAAALRMVADKPLLGRGWGGYQRDSLNYYRQSQDYPLTIIQSVHNLLLVNMVDLGLIGAGLWLTAIMIAVIGGATRRGPPELRPWRIALLGVGASYGVVAMTTPLGYSMPTLALWVWAGIAWSVVRAPHPALAIAGTPGPSPEPAVPVAAPPRRRRFRVDLGAPFAGRREALWLAAAVVVSLAVGAVYWLALKETPLAGDELHYDSAGKLAAAGHWFWGTSPFGTPHPSVWKPPAYPFWVQFFYDVLGADARQVEVIQLATLAPLSVLLTWLLARRLTGDWRIAVTAALVMAIYPMAWQYQGLLYPESLAIPAALVLLIVALGRTPTYARAAAVGALFGVNLLVRPSAFFLIAGVFAAWLVSHGLRRTLAAAVVVALAAAAVIAPWTVRNVHVTHRFVVLSVQDLAISGTFNASAAHDKRFPYRWRAVPDRERDLGKLDPKPTEVELRDLLKHRAYDYIKAHPESVPKAFFWNGLSRFWDVRRPSNAIAETPSEGRLRGVTIAALIGYYALLPLALLGLWRLRRRRKDLVAAVLVAAAVASVIFTVDSGTRYRAPFEPVIVVLACIAVFSLRGREPDAGVRPERA